jgi:TonB-dependent starch-binding outer membrane protein SusC
MRTFLLLAIFSITQLFAANVASQSIRLGVTDLTVREVFREIERQSDYSFFYNDRFSDLDKKVSFPEMNTTIYGAMESILASTNRLLTGS